MTCPSYGGGGETHCEVVQEKGMEKFTVAGNGRGRGRKQCAEARLIEVSIKDVVGRESSMGRSQEQEEARAGILICLNCSMASLLTRGSWAYVMILSVGSCGNSPVIYIH